LLGFLGAALANWQLEIWKILLRYQNSAITAVLKAEATTAVAAANAACVTTVVQVKIAARMG
jgi:hypothetical protein